MNRVQLHLSLDSNASISVINDDTGAGGTLGLRGNHDGALADLG